MADCLKIRFELNGVNKAAVIPIYWERMRTTKPCQIDELTVEWS